MAVKKMRGCRIDTDFRYLSAQKQLDTEDTEISRKTTGTQISSASSKAHLDVGVTSMSKLFGGLCE